MPKLPVVSGRTLIRFLTDLGYSVIRRRGSHVRLEKQFATGAHGITVPDHREIARGTLNVILNRVSERAGIGKDELIRLVRGS